MCRWQGLNPKFLLCRYSSKFNQCSTTAPHKENTHLEQCDNEPGLRVERVFDVLLDPLAESGRVGVGRQLLGHLLLHAEQGHQEGELIFLQQVDQGLVRPQRLRDEVLDVQALDGVEGLLESVLVPVQTLEHSLEGEQEDRVEVGLVAQQFG